MPQTDYVDGLTDAFMGYRDRSRSKKRSNHVRSE